ncbi:hypothetical protein KsCSTR_16080 [Candidatus Kuenenia stuttgartiensis]|uniref:Uncharacterized protein n=2 Tax=Candidatus Kuenenia TaxID=380738 RepID=Q1Q1S1_KUEST|nr:hypothetical protein KsCSTR_16080 [Candidatus Kuenenia stuttgartiensis]CAJ73964.1 unknown protein [Candidatus Kuenenia stuttgartiensis]
MHPHKKYSPAFNPDSSSMGLMSSSVVPGYVVDSRTISCHLQIFPAMVFVVLKTYDISGSRYLSSGVGTQMMIQSIADNLEKSVVGVKCNPVPVIRELSICLIYTVRVYK